MMINSGLAYMRVPSNDRTDGLSWTNPINMDDLGLSLFHETSIDMAFIPMIDG